MGKTIIGFFKWFFIVLFASYVSGISLFTHTHIINNTAYVHSHPFKKGEKTQHGHTGKQLFILEHYHKTTITPDVIPEIDLSDLSLPRAAYHTDYYKSTHTVKPLAHLSLRGPPTAV